MLAKVSGYAASILHTMHRYCGIEYFFVSLLVITNCFYDPYTIVACAYEDIFYSGVYTLNLFSPSKEASPRKSSKLSKGKAQSKTTPRLECRILLMRKRNSFEGAPIFSESTTTQPFLLRRLKTNGITPYLQCLQILMSGIMRHLSGINLLRVG